MRKQDELTSLKVVQNLYGQFGIKTSLSTNTYDHYDIKTENNWLLEVKARRLNYNQFIKYNKEGFIMENVKYKFLSEYENSRYINVFNMNNKTFTVSWKVSNIKPTIKDMYCKSTTEFSNNGYRKKEIILLKAEDAIIYLLKGEEFKMVSFNDLIEEIC